MGILPRRRVLGRARSSQRDGAVAEKGYHPRKLVPRTPLSKPGLSSAWPVRSRALSRRGERVVRPRRASGVAAPSPPLEARILRRRLADPLWHARGGGLLLAPPPRPPH